MSFARTLARNVFSNSFGFVVNAVVGILLLPFMEDQLGAAAYGFWSLLISCTGYYGLLDIGVRSAVGQYVTRYWAKGELDKVNQTLSTAAALMLAGSAIVLVAGAIVAWFAPQWFRFASAEPSTARLLFAIVALGVAANLPLMLSQCATYARSRFDIAQAIGITERLVFVGLAVWLLLDGYGLLELAIANAATQLVSNLVRCYVGFRLLPGVRISRRFVKRESVRELYGYSIFSVLINAGDTVLAYSSAVVIPIAVSLAAWWSGPATRNLPADESKTAVDLALGHYSFGSLLVFYMLSLISSVAWTITPHATTKDAQGDLGAVRRLWVTGSRLTLAFAAVVGGGVILVSGDFLTLLVGPEYMSGEVFVSSAVLAGVLTAGALCRSAMTIGRQICFGLREVRFLARVSLLEAIGTLLLGTALGASYGLLGVALGSVLASAFTQLVVMPRFLSKRLDVPVGEYYRTVPWPALAVLASMALASQALDGAFDGQGWAKTMVEYGEDNQLSAPARSWLFVIVVSAVLGTVGAVMAFLFGTNRDEKQMLLRRLRAVQRKPA